MERVEFVSDLLLGIFLQMERVEFVSDLLLGILFKMERVEFVSDLLLEGGILLPMKLGIHIESSGQDDCYSKIEIS